MNDKNLILINRIQMCQSRFLECTWCHFSYKIICLYLWTQKTKLIQVINHSLTLSLSSSRNRVVITFSAASFLSIQTPDTFSVPAKLDERKEKSCRCIRDLRLPVLQVNQINPRSHASFQSSKRGAV
ncbi:hypothetical protein BT93_E2500 [Corymbia citriodora subsp. variegata]|nr:hypothetical protein BT93_E2500 [Corymbia citriodora subsp. variegata]